MLSYPRLRTSPISHTSPLFDLLIILLSPFPAIACGNFLKSRAIKKEYLVTGQGLGLRITLSPLNLSLFFSCFQAGNLSR